MYGKQVIKRELLKKVTKVKEDLVAIADQLQGIKVIEDNLEPLLCWWCRPDTTDHVTAARNVVKLWETMLKKELT